MLKPYHFFCQLHEEPNFPLYWMFTVIQLTFIHHFTRKISRSTSFLWFQLKNIHYFEKSWNELDFCFPICNKNTFPPNIILCICSLSIHTEPKGGIEIDNLVTIQVNDFNQALRLYRLGCRFRSTASTNSNRTSSRSHW